MVSFSATTIARLGALQVNRNVTNAGDPHLPTCSFFLGDGQEAGGNGKPYSYSTILNISESGNTGENGNYSQVSFPSIQESARLLKFMQTVVLM